MVVELGVVGTDKGDALEELRHRIAASAVLFVGDDRTDEDGIAAVQAAGGFGVRVGGGVTRARYRLADPASVGAWLRTALEPETTSQETRAA